MESKGIRWGSVLRERGVPCNLLRLGDQIERGSSQRGHVQRLANVAGRLVPVGVAVERRASGEVQQRHATQ